MKPLLIVLSLLVAAVTASEGNAAVRLHLPVHVDGPHEIKVARLIKRHHRIDLRRYTLKAVILKPTRRADGYSFLRVGRYRSPSLPVEGRDRVVRLAAPYRGRGDWRLYISRGAEVRSIVAVLEPRGVHRARHDGNVHYLPRDTVLGHGPAVMPYAGYHPRRSLIRKKH